MKISKLMGLKKSQYELDFYDFDVSMDTYKFFDPYYISKSDNVFLKECNEYIASFLIISYIFLNMVMKHKH